MTFCTHFLWYYVSCTFPRSRTCDIKTYVYGCVSVAKKDVRHTSVLFTGTTKSPFSTSHISITTGLISIKFTYCMPSIYITFQTKFEENWISILRDICFWKLPIFFTFSSSLHQFKTITLNQENQPSPGWISFRCGTSIRHILANRHLKCRDV